MSDIRKALEALRNKASQDVRGDGYSLQDAAYLAGVEGAIREYDVAVAALSQPQAAQPETHSFDVEGYVKASDVLGPLSKQMILELVVEIERLRATPPTEPAQGEKS